MPFLVYYLHSTSLRHRNRTGHAARDVSTQVTDIQESKAIVLDYFDALERAPADMTAGAIRPFAAADYSFRGVHPHIMS